MDDLIKRIKERNKETLVVNDISTDIKTHLAVNKVLLGKNKGKVVKGFFKLVDDKLQVHINLGDYWLEFWVLDSNEYETALNKKLNVVRS